MKMSKVGNQTNSQDPQAVNSRVFVGNLNTFQCSKTDVERMFQRYGRLAGISMHKGYAFVQFTNPFDARSACLGEDGRTVLSQILDVNMVAEPKPHQTGRKRQNVAKTGNDWDYYYDSYYASTSFSVGSHRLVPPVKRQRLMSTAARNGKSNHQKTTLIPPLDQLKVYSNPDILICGNCREMFTDLHDLLDHKKTYCKLRFTCKCDSNKNKPSMDDNSSASLLCVQCKDAFQNAWDLMVHAQAAHMLNIYELGVPAVVNCSSPPLSPMENSTSDKHFITETIQVNQSGSQMTGGSLKTKQTCQTFNINIHNEFPNFKFTAYNMNTKNSDSDSDVSTNSSWTILDEEKETKEGTLPNITPKSSKEKLEEICHVDDSVVIVPDAEALELSSSQHSLKNDGFYKVSKSDTSLGKSDGQISGDELKDVQRTKENGYLTFDEYLQARMLEYDYNFPASAVVKQKFKKVRKGERKKCKGETLGVLSLCAAMLTVTGIALLCLIFPDNVSDKQFDVIKTNFETVVKNDSLDYNNIASNFTKTLEILDAAKEANLINKTLKKLQVEDKKQPNKTDPIIGPPRDALQSKAKLKPPKKSSSKPFSTFKYQDDVCYPSDRYYTYSNNNFNAKFRNLRRSSPMINTRKVTPPSNGTISTALSKIQKILSNSNLHCIICAIINDICMLKLVSYFNRPQENSMVCPKKKKEKVKKSSSKINRVPSGGNCRITPEEMKIRKIKIAKRKLAAKKNKGEDVPVKMSEPKLALPAPRPTQLLEQALESKAKFVFLPPPEPTTAVALFSINQTKSNSENGKSECERRFDELDEHRKKGADVSMKHKDYIRMIKNRYDSEVAMIRESIHEPSLRLKRIEAIREKYRQRLKRNRDKFMETLKKMRAQRMKIMKDICNTKITDTQYKDASVGNYVVPLFDYEEMKKRIRLIQKDEKAKNPEEVVFNKLKMETNAMRTKQFFNNPPIARSVIQNQVIRVDSAQGLKTCTSKELFVPRTTKSNNLFDAPGKVIRLQDNSPKKSQSQSFGINPNALARVAADNWLNKQRISKKQSPVSADMERANISELQDEDGINKFRKAALKNNTDNLYMLAFEQMGKQIQRKEEMKWTYSKVIDKIREKPYSKDLGKQDPQKAYKPNILFRQF